MPLDCQRMFYDTALVSISTRSLVMTTEPKRAALDLTFKSPCPHSFHWSSTSHPVPASKGCMERARIKRFQAIHLPRLDHQPHEREDRHPDASEVPDAIKPFASGFQFLY